MPIIITDDGTEIFYKNGGTGQPIVFRHGPKESARTARTFGYP